MKIVVFFFMFSSVYTPPGASWDSQHSPKCFLDRSGAILRAFSASGRPIVISRESFEASGQPLVGPSQLLAASGQPIPAFSATRSVCIETQDLDFLIL